MEKKVFKIVVFFLSIPLTLLLVGCEQTRDALGLKRTQVDEFQVTDRQPLTTPPHLKDRPLLPPGKAGPSDKTTPENAAQKALLGSDSSSDTTTSSAEKDLLSKAAPENDGSIRDILETEQGPVEQKAPGEDLVFWKKTKSKKGDVIDPIEEREKFQKTNSSETEEAPAAP
jgi:hypothetical protein